MSAISLSFMTLFFSILVLAIVTLVPETGAKCAPGFVEAGSSIGKVDGKQVRILGIDKKRCWIVVAAMDSGARYWVSGSAIRYGTTDETVGP